MNASDITAMAPFVAAILVLKLVGTTTNNNLRLPGTNSQRATDLLTRKFPPQPNLAPIHI